MQRLSKGWFPKNKLLQHSVAAHALCVNRPDLTSHALLSDEVRGVRCATPGNSGPECCAVADKWRLISAVRKVEFRLLHTISPTDHRNPLEHATLQTMDRTKNPREPMHRPTPSNTQSFARREGDSPRRKQ